MLKYDKMNEIDILLIQSQTIGHINHIVVSLRGRHTMRACYRSLPQVKVSRNLHPEQTRYQKV